MPRQPQRGYTLVELLLVVAIFVLISGMAVPMFVSSFAGAKLRTSVRAVVMANRYARNLAVLRQRPVAMLVNSQSNTFEVVLLTGRESEDLSELTSPTPDETDANTVDMPTNNVTNMGDAVTNADALAEDKATSDLIKGLQPGVSIDSFETQRPGSADPNAPGIVVYYPSGLCDGFTLRLVDERGRQAEITADPLTGQMDVKYAEN